MFDEDKLKRWFQLEGHTLNQALVRSPRPLAEVLAMDEPSLPTKGGGEHVFDRAVLERLADELSPLVRASVKVPIHVYHHHETEHDCYVTGEANVKALLQLEIAHTEPRDGKLWISLPLARRAARDWPTIFQLVRY